MKMQIRNIFSKTAFVYFTAASLLCIPMVSVQAQKIAKTSPPEVLVNYDKTSGQDMLIKVQFDNKNKELLSLDITDEDGNFLYSERVSGERFSKRFQVDPNYDKIKLYLSVIGSKGKSSVYIINNNVRTITVRDVEVTKL